MKSPGKLLAILMVSIFLFVAVQNVYADEPWSKFKQKKLTLIVPYGAGGSTNATVRLLGQSLVKLGLKVNVVNKPGASGTEGTYFVSRQKPDSGVLLATSPTAFHFLPASENTGYTWKDFDPYSAHPTIVVDNV